MFYAFQDFDVSELLNQEWCIVSLFDVFVDRVFKSDSSMRTVYEQGAKDAAISVVRGVNCE